MDQAKDRVRRIVEDLSERMKIPAPELEFTESRSPSEVGARAFWGRGKIRVSSGFLNLSPPDEEIEGIMAHELIHVQQRHSARGLAILGPIGLVGGSVAAGLFLGSNTLTGTLTAYLSIGVILSTLVLLKRHSEYWADRGAAKVTDPTFLIRGLELLESYRPSGWRITHPPLTKRIERLKKLIR